MLALAFTVGDICYTSPGRKKNTKNTASVREGKGLSRVLTHQANPHLLFTSLHFVEIPTNRLDLLFNKS